MRIWIQRWRQSRVAKSAMISAKGAFPVLPGRWVLNILLQAMPCACQCQHPEPFPAVRSAGNVQAAIRHQSSTIARLVCSLMHIQARVLISIPGRHLHLRSIQGDWRSDAHFSLESVKPFNRGSWWTELGFTVLGRLWWRRSCSLESQRKNGPMSRNILHQQMSASSSEILHDIIYGR
jgi:hypothetical protein